MYCPVLPVALQRDFICTREEEEDLTVVRQKQGRKRDYESRCMLWLKGREGRGAEDKERNEEIIITRLYRHFYSLIP